MMREWPEVWRKREEWYVYCYEAVHQQSRRDGGRREGGGGYRAIARFKGGGGRSDMCE